MESSRLRDVWNCDEVAYGIARSAYKALFLRLDSIQCSALIPFRLTTDSIPQQVADDIHASGVMRTQYFKSKQKNVKMSFLSIAKAMGKMELMSFCASW